MGVLPQLPSFPTETAASREVGWSEEAATHAEKEPIRERERLQLTGKQLEERRHRRIQPCTFRIRYR